MEFITFIWYLKILTSINWFRKWVYFGFSSHFYNLIEAGYKNFPLELNAVDYFQDQDLRDRFSRFWKIFPIFTNILVYSLFEQGVWLFKELWSCSKIKVSCSSWIRNHIKNVSILIPKTNLFFTWNLNPPLAFLFLWN